jgi:catechol 2,3-dioxygenase-like lactoylglutathione lyase family enzyme
MLLYSQHVDVGDKLNHHEIIPVLSVRSLPQGVAFYQKLGFVMDFTRDAQALLSRNSSKLRLREKADLDNESLCGAYFSIDRADAFLQKLYALEIAVREKSDDRPWRMREFSVSDPDGNRLRFGEKFQDGVYS